MLVRRFLPFIVVALFGQIALASDAHDWLAKMESAARTLNYDGVFVYHNGSNVQTMRIVHRMDKGKTQERLVSLNGPRREITRTDEEVRCYLPDENSVLVEHRQAGNKVFPGILPQRLSDLDKLYEISLARTGRVADRDAQHVVVHPRDGYRYGYHLWADTATGLLLRADLVDNENHMVEQFVFTSVRPGIAIPDRDLKPHFGNKESVVHRAEGVNDKRTPGWEAAALPPGFTLTNYVNRRIPGREKSVEHLVYSDGLAAVSVFVEQAGEEARPERKGPKRIGAVHAFVKVVDGHRVTVVGEVPAGTIDMIGQSVRRRDAADE